MKTKRKEEEEEEEKKRKEKKRSEEKKVSFGIELSTFDALDQSFTIRSRGTHQDVSPNFIIKTFEPH